MRKNNNILKEIKSHKEYLNKTIEHFKKKEAAIDRKYRKLCIKQQEHEEIKDISKIRKKIEKDASKLEKDKREFQKKQNQFQELRKVTKFQKDAAHALEQLFQIFNRVEAS